MDQTISQLAALASQGYTLVTPNTRLASSLGIQIKQLDHVQGVSRSPEIYSYDAFVATITRERVFGGQLSARKLVDDATEQWLWEEAIRCTETNESGNGQGSTDAFAPVSLLSSRGAAAEAQRAYRLALNWLIDVDEHRFTFQSNVDSQCFLAWAAQFERLTKNLGLCNSVQLQHALLAGEFKETFLQAFKPAKSRGRTVEKLAAVGFQVVDPLQAQCFDHFSNNNWLDIQLVKPAPKDKKSEHCVVLANDTEDEWRKSAVWLFASHKNNPSGKYAVVIPSLAKNRLRIDRIFSEQAKHSVVVGHETSYNMSSGNPLATMPLIKHWLWLTQALSADLSREQTIELILSPFLFLESDLAVRNQLSQAVCDSGERRFSLREWLRLLEWANKDLASLQGAVNQDSLDDESKPGDFVLSLRKFNGRLSTRSSVQEGAAAHNTSFSLSGSRNISKWLDIYESLANHFSWAVNRPLSSDEYQQSEMFLNALNELRQQSAIYGQITAIQAQRITQRFLQSKIYQPQTLYTTNGYLPEVLGVLEAGGQQYDGLWLCEMSDVDWPAPAKPNSLLPYGLQLELGMPGSSSREQLYAQRQTEGLINASSNLVVSYCREIDEAKTRISPYLSQLPGALHTDIETPELDDVSGLDGNTGLDGNACVKRFGSEIIECLEDAVGMPLLNSVSDAAKNDEQDGTLKLRGGSYMLADYARSPLLAYFKHRLEISDLPLPHQGLSAKERGICLHNSMERFWSSFSDQAGLLNADKASIDGVLGASIDDALVAISAQRFKALHATELHVEKTGLMTVLSAWLDLEKQRLPFEVVAKEYTFEYCHRDVKVAGRVDRIDCINSSDLMLIDYKSGATSIAGWFEEGLPDPQLPFYAVALSSAQVGEFADKTVNGISFANLKIGNISMQGVTGADADAKTDSGVRSIDKLSYTDISAWSELLGSWQVNIDAHLTGMINGDASMDIYDDLSESAYQPLLRSGYYRYSNSPLSDDKSAIKEG